ncbi:helix-turn-helix domain-containing protein [Methylobacterium sp. J-030]|uniref:helix-turn-helix domain-containing protein n=1 Tax=Methylobacterium sp. J-030 TaxID=2836627 RepID=UPI00391BD7D1
MSNYVRLLSVSEACATLGIGRTRFYELLNSQALRAVKLGRRRLIRSDELDRLIQALTANAAEHANDEVPR